MAGDPRDPLRTLYVAQESLLIEWQSFYAEYCVREAHGIVVVLSEPLFDILWYLERSYRVAHLADQTVDASAHLTNS
jgi:hypothetical protein